MEKKEIELWGAKVKLINHVDEKGEVNKNFFKTLSEGFALIERWDLRVSSVEEFEDYSKNGNKPYIIFTSGSENRTQPMEVTVELCTECKMGISYHTLLCKIGAVQGVMEE